MMTSAATAVAARLSRRSRAREPAVRVSAAASAALEKRKAVAPQTVFSCQVVWQRRQSALAICGW
jgi:hypothetical protein